MAYEQEPADPLQYPKDVAQQMLDEALEHVEGTGAAQWGLSLFGLWKSGSAYANALMNNTLCSFADTAAKAFALGASIVGVVGLVTVNPALLLAGAGLTMGAAALSAAAELARGLNGGQCGPDFPNPEYPFKDPPVSPLIIDLNGDGVTVSALGDSNVYFDIDGDGFAEKTAWVTNGDGLLVIDRNADGEINDISELFGSATQDGFSQLREFDSNADGLISSSDQDFDQLRVWVDENNDGVAQEEELKSLDELGIASINVNATQVTETNNGNPVTHRGTITFTNSTTANIDDVWFQNDQASTREVLPAGFEFDPEALLLPNLKGEGSLSALSVAMTRDPALLALVKTLVLNANDMSGADLRAAVEMIVLRWAGATEVDPGSRGGFMDASHLAVLEAIFGEPFLQNRGTNAGTNNPGPNAGFEMEKQYQSYIDAFTSRISAQILQSQVNLFYVDKMDGQDLIDGKFTNLFSLGYNDFTGRMTAFEFSDSIPFIFSELPTDFDDSLDYIEFVMTVLRGARIDLFNGNDSNYFASLDAGLIAIEDQALRAYARAIASGAQLVSGTAAGETLNTAEATRHELIRDDTGISQILVGGEGADTLTGGTGGDYYLFRVGDGHDLIEDHGAANWNVPGQADSNWHFGNKGGIDRILMLGIDQSDLVMTKVGFDLIITITGNITDSVTVKDHFLGAKGAIEEVVAADGVLTYADIELLTSPRVATTGGAGAQVVTGTTGDDILDGGLGNDLYLFGPGSGSDTIVKGADAATSHDQIRVAFDSTQVFAAIIGNDIVLRFFDVTQDGNGNTVRTLRPEILTLEDQLVGHRTVESIIFKDGVEYSGSSIQWVLARPDGTFNAPFAAEEVTFTRGDGTLHPTSDLVGWVDGDVEFTIENFFFQEITYFDGTGYDFFYADGRDQDVAFADGFILKRADIIAQFPLDGTSGADYLRGSEIGETISGGAGNDAIHAGDGDDIIIGGLGDDILFGDSEFQPAIPMRMFSEPLVPTQGSDTYIYASGDGNDTIIDRGQGGLDVDTLKFVDLDPEDVIITRVWTERNDIDHRGREVPDTTYLSHDLLIHIIATNQTIRVVDQFLDDLTGLELIEFANSVTLNRDQIFELSVLVDDETFATELAGAGRVDAGDRFAFIYGTTGSDTLIFGKTGISQTIVDFAKIELKDILASEVSLNRVGDDLLLQISGSAVTLTYEDYFQWGFEVLQSIQFANGEVWTPARIFAEAAVEGTALNDNIVGTTGDDVIHGGDGDDTIDGDEGNDVITGGAGEDTLYGGDGNDRFVVEASDGDDIIDGGLGTDTYDASAISTALTVNLGTGSASSAAGGTDTLTSIENVIGGSGDDTITGNALNNYLSGGRGNDTLNGGDGDDLLEGGAGADAIDGGSGNDTATYASSRAAVTVSLAAGTGSGGDATGDTLSNVENVIGSNYSDTISGNGQANILDLGNGNDLAHAGAGDDVVYGGKGDDEIYGEDGHDQLFGGEGNDEIDGGAGNDLLEGGVGADLLRGGDGSDEYVWSRGDGNDTIIESVGLGSDVDTLAIHGYAPNQFRIESYRGDITLVSVAGERITIVAQLGGPTGQGIEQVVFDDTTIWDADYLATNAVETGNNPVIAITDRGFVTDEDVPIVITAAALIQNDYDRDGDTITLMSVGSGVGGTVEITLEGDIRFSPTANYNGPASFSYTVSDGFGSTSTATVHLTVAPVNDAPVITSNGGGPTASVTIDENTIAVTTVTSTDVDSGATATYSIVGGADAAKFSINSTTGVLAFIAAPDFEAPSDVGANNVYDVVVQVSDGELVATQAIAVTVADVAEGGGTILGTGGNDILYGTSAGETIIGLAGDDILNGGGGDDTYIYSRGDGHDVIVEGASDGNADVLQVNGVNGFTQTAITASGNDLLITIDPSAPGAGDEGSILIEDYFNMAGDYGVETIVDGFSNVWTKADVFQFLFGNSEGGLTIWTGSDDDTLIGTAQNDVFHSGAGNDHLFGGAGDDTLVAYEGNDLIEGGTGDDWLVGGDGNDTYIYNRGDGDDSIIEGASEGDADVLQINGVNAYTQTVLSASGNDLLIEIDPSSPGAGDEGAILIKDFLNMAGDYGVETIIDSDSNTFTKEDVFLFLYGNNEGGLTIWRGADEDTLIGTAQNDVFHSGAGDDYLFGGAGDDTLVAYEGDDILEGGSGDDWLVGGTGEDTFVFRSGFGQDEIGDFEVGVDVLEFHDQGTLDFAGLMADAEEWGGNAWLHFDGGHRVILYGVGLDDLSASDFRFV